MFDGLLQAFAEAARAGRRATTIMVISIATTDEFTHELTIAITDTG
jgi:hypothetical protein